jgi:acyl-CoA dehydrogenase
MVASQHLMNAMLNKHEQPSVLSAVMKQQMTDKGRICINEAMDIIGGAGALLSWPVLRFF